MNSRRMPLDHLHCSLEDPSLEAMNFLNEIAIRFPEAVSFASGRPHDEFLDPEDVHRYLNRYLAYLRTECGQPEPVARRTLLQYGRTKGIIHELIAKNLAVDEGIHASYESIVVTVGCQEAMFLVLRALRSDERDVVFAVAPTYVGLTGAARLVDLPVRAVQGGPDGIDIADLEHQLRVARREGLRPRACYVIPNFANPTGLSLKLETRRQLLDVAAREGLLLLEDNPYGLFTDEQERLPSLKALDTAASVVYLGSFAKTGLPGARVGFVVADQAVQGGQADTRTLADELAKIKSMVTLNTSPVAQAVIGGKLLLHNGSLAAATSRETATYKRNRKAMLAGLQRRFPGGTSGPSVSWTAPEGGFFVVLTVPFDVDDALLARSATEYGVLWTPIAHFYQGGGPFRQLRLSFSSVTEADIELGLDRLAALISDVSAESAGQLTPSSRQTSLGSAIADEYLALADDSCVALLPHVLRIALEFGLPERLSTEPVEVAALAATVGADADACARLLRALASVGLVQEAITGHFALTAAGQVLRSSHPLSVQESVAQLDSLRAWMKAGDSFRTGRPVSLDENGDDVGFFEHKDGDLAAKRSFMRRMRERARRGYGHLVPMVDWNRSRVLLDVGGSDGLLLELVLRHAPHLFGVLFDLPGVVACVGQPSGDLAERLRVEAGDFFEKIPAGADTHLMSSVLHDWPDERALEILRHSRAAIEPDGRLLIVEMVRPKGDTWHPSKWSDLGMLVLTGGRERSEAEFRDLLARSGYALDRVRELPRSAYSVLEAHPI